MKYKICQYARYIGAFIYLCLILFCFIFNTDTSTRFVRDKVLSRKILGLMIAARRALSRDAAEKVFADAAGVQLCQPVNRTALFISSSGKLDLASLAIALLTAFRDDLLSSLRFLLSTPR